MTWTQFWDMHSGGGLKQAPYAKIYIEASEEEAIKIFVNRFGHRPDDVACDCCGDNYSVSSGESLQEMTSYHRNCANVAFYKDDGTEAIESQYGGGLDYDYETRVFRHKGREVETRSVERPSLTSMKYGATRQTCIDRYRTLTQYISSNDVLVISADEIIAGDRA